MKLTCCYCRKVFDNGKKKPAHWEDIPPDKTHGICPECGPKADKEFSDYLAEKKKKLDTLKYF